MQLLDGKEVSKAKREQLKPRVDAFKARTGRSPHLVVVLVGEDPASQIYVRNKQKACESVGIKSTLTTLAKTTTQSDLNQLIQKLNNDGAVDGILVQFPLPKPLSQTEVMNLVSPKKDVDGFNPISKVSPCTPVGVMSILSHYKINPSGMNAVVVGRSAIVGKPMADLLLKADATVTVCHSKTKDVSQYTKMADLVVVAAGKKHLLGKQDFKKDAIVIDVGMHGTGAQGSSLTGDVRFSELDGWVKAASPVPGGVGPMTITSLLENTLTLAEASFAK